MRCQPFVAETIEPFNSRRSFLAHLLAKRFRRGGASEAGARTDQKAGAARRRSASEGHRQGRVARSSCHAAELPKTRPDFARRPELQLLQLQLSAFCKRSHMPPRALTFDMRGAQKAQPFGHPLDGRVRRRD